MSELTSSDLMNFASSLRENEGIFGGNGLWFLLILFFLFSGGFGFGGNSQALTRAEMQDGFNNQNIVNTLGNLGSSINSGFDNIQLAMNNGFNSINSNINQLGFNMQNCCCDIKNAIHSENEAVRALITQNTIQDLRDSVAAKDRELLTSSLVTSNVLQTSNIENFMRTLFNSPCSC